MRKYGDDGIYSSLDVMCPNCGRWHSRYTECSCSRRFYGNYYASLSYGNDNNYDRDYNEPYYSGNKTVICRKCGRTYHKRHSSCPYCKKTKSKSTYKSNHGTNDDNWVTCPMCNFVYNKKRNSLCPYCKNSREASDSKNSTNSKGTSIAFIISLLILFSFAAYGYLPSGDLFATMIFGFMGFVVGLVVFAFIIVIYEHYYLHKK